MPVKAYLLNFEVLEETKEIPEEWKCAFIHPLYKTGDKTHGKSSYLQGNFFTAHDKILSSTSELIEGATL